MATIPSHRQYLQINPVDRIKYQIAQGKTVSGTELASAVKRSLGCDLPPELLELLVAFSVPAVKRRGRPPNCLAREDFALEELDERYSALLPQLQAESHDTSTRQDGSPSERAYRQLATEMCA